MGTIPKHSFRQIRKKTAQDFKQEKKKKRQAREAISAFTTHWPARLRRAELASHQLVSQESGFWHGDPPPKPGKGTGCPQRSWDDK